MDRPPGVYRIRRSMSSSQDSRKNKKPNLQILTWEPPMPHSDSDSVSESSTVETFNLQRICAKAHDSKTVKKKYYWRAQADFVQKETMVKFLKLRWKLLKKVRQSCGGTIYGMLKVFARDVRSIVFPNCFITKGRATNLHLKNLKLQLCFQDITGDTIPLVATIWIGWTLKQSYCRLN